MSDLLFIWIFVFVIQFVFFTSGYLFYRKQYKYSLWKTILVSIVPVLVPMGIFTLNVLKSKYLDIFTDWLFVKKEKK
jgi:uncharacterized protein (DUF983 family)